jgi:hypothetical protein
MAVVVSDGVALDVGLGPDAAHVGSSSELVGLGLLVLPHGLVRGRGNRTARNSVRVCRSVCAST